MHETILSVTISTHKPDGILDIAKMSLPVVDGVEYIVSWQSHENQPIPDSIADREDISVHRTNSHGLSNNRNNAIKHSVGEIILIADDDLIYTSKQLEAVINTFKKHPHVEMAIFQHDGFLRKTYPPQMICLNHNIPRFFSPASVEIAFRRKTIEQAGLQFSPDFGLGTDYFTAGEDDLFFYRALKLGVKTYFFPITIVTHHDIPTGGVHILTPGALRTKGALIALTHPLTFPIRIFVNAMRLTRAKRAKMIQATTTMLKGALKALSTRDIRKYMCLP